MVILEVLRKAKGLLLTAVMLFVLDVSLFLQAGVDGSLASSVVKYVALTLLGFPAIRIIWKSPNESEKKMKFWALYRFLSFVTLIEDLAIAQGFLLANTFWVMTVAQIVVLLVYVRVLQVYDRMLDRGEDLLLTEDIREWIDRFEQKSPLSRLASGPMTWLLCTFWYGSDALVLLRRKGSRTTTKDIWTILVPSSVIGTAGVASAIGLIVEMARRLF
ncbi:hypothetical protein EPO05_00720 [Patescibacteria group bacterium]|nr:MAG: hypothetical protein EPO05_00720 [Patescibacteria group bacterium]